MVTQIQVIWTPDQIVNMYIYSIYCAVAVGIIVVDTSGSK